MIRGFAALILERKLLQSNTVQIKSVATASSLILGIKHNPHTAKKLYNHIRDIIEDKRGRLWGINGVGVRGYRYRALIYHFPKQPEGER